MTQIVFYNNSLFKRFADSNSVDFAIGSPLGSVFFNKLQTF